MLANEILRNLEQFHFKKYFEGIFAADTVPKKLPNKHFLIVNTDVSSGSGKHWFAIVRINNLIECFDSLGLKEEQKHFLCSHFNIKGISHVTYNVTQLQPTTSILCGQFVLYFLFERYYNLDMSFDDLLNESFSNNTNQNENTIQEFIENFLK